MNQVAAAALAWDAAGVCALPARTDGTKAPSVAWKDYQTSRYPRDKVAAISTGYGLLCGTISGNLEMVELEGRAIAEGAWKTIAALAAADPAVADVWHLVTAGPDAYLERTPSGGVHILYRLADGQVPGNTKLASRPAHDDELTDQERDLLTRHPDKVIPRVLAETRGEGGFVVVAPSNGPTHPTGQPWTIIVGTPGQVPTITPTQRDQLHGLLRALDRMPPPATSNPVPNPATATSTRPGDDFNARTTWAEILEPHGWRNFHTDSQGIGYWTRPGKAMGVSATTNAVGTDTLHIFTSSTEFAADSWHDKFGAYAILNHRGDHQAAARALSSAGYGDTPDQAALIAGIVGPAPAAAAIAAAPRQDPDAGPTSARFFKKSSLLVQTLADEVLDLHPCALTPEQRVAVYRDGVYHIDQLALAAVCTRLLGDQFTKRHEDNVARFIAGRLHEQGRYLPTQATAPVLNLRNGMLDLLTGQLHPHDPEHLSAIQLPVAWDPTATCPTYEAWLNEVIPDQADDLEETVATMLDPSRTPTRALFAYGPSRSGKSTFLRLAAEIAGLTNTSAVTLHQLVEDRFAAANLYGKIFNSAADISAAHIEDMSTFKMLTGEDPIIGNRKYGGQFLFTNRALFAFSANTLPTVGESSRAYVERIKPFAFKSSFAGHEKPEIEIAMRSELAGILVRWVRAWQRLTARGQRLETPADVRAEFEERSDRVRQWVADCCEITGGGSATPGAILPPSEVASKRWLARAFNAWAREQGGSPMGERKIVERLTSINGIVEVRNSIDRSRGLNLRVVGVDATFGILGGG